MSGKNKGPQTKRPVTTAFEAGQKNPYIEPLFSDAEMAAILKNTTITNINGFNKVTTGNNIKINTDPIMLFKDRALKAKNEKLYKLLTATSAASILTFFDDAKKELKKQHSPTLDATDKTILRLVGNHLLGTESFNKENIQDTHRKLYHYMRVMNLNYQRMNTTQRNTISNILIQDLPQYARQRPQTSAAMTYPPVVEEMQTTPRVSTAMGNEPDTEDRAFSPFNMPSRRSESPSPDASPRASHTSTSPFDDSSSSTSFDFTEEPQNIRAPRKAATPEEYIIGFQNKILTHIHEKQGLLEQIMDANPEKASELASLESVLTTDEASLQALTSINTDVNIAEFSKTTTLLAIKRADFLEKLYENTKKSKPINNADDTLSLTDSIEKIRRSVTPEAGHIDLEEFSNHVIISSFIDEQTEEAIPSEDLTDNQEEETTLLEAEYKRLSPVQKNEVDRKTNALNAILVSLDDIDMHLGAYSQTPPLEDLYGVESDLDLDLDLDLEDFSSQRSPSSRSSTPSPSIISVEDAIAQTGSLSASIDPLIAERDQTENLALTVETSLPVLVTETQRLIQTLYMLKNETLSIMHEDGTFPSLSENKVIHYSEIARLLNEQLDLSNPDLSGALDTLETLLTTKDNDGNLVYLETGDNEKITQLLDTLDTCKVRLEQLTRITNISGGNITLQHLIQEAYPDEQKTQENAKFFEETLQAPSITAAKNLFTAIMDLEKIKDFLNSTAQDADALETLKKSLATSLNPESFDLEAALATLKTLIYTTDNQGNQTYLLNIDGHDLHDLKDSLAACTERWQALESIVQGFSEDPNAILSQALQQLAVEAQEKYAQAPHTSVDSAQTPGSQPSAHADTAESAQQALTSARTSSVQSTRTIPTPKGSGVPTRAILRTLEPPASSRAASVVSEPPGSQQHTESYTKKRPSAIEITKDASSIKSSKHRKTGSLLSHDESVNISFSKERAPADHAFLSELRTQFFSQIEASTQQLLDPNPPFKSDPNTADRDRELAQNHRIDADTLTCSVQSKQTKDATLETSAVKVTQVDEAYHLTQENPFTDTGFAGMLEMASAYIATAQSKGKKVHGFEVDYTPLSEKNLKDVILYAAKMQMVLTQWGISAPLSAELQPHQAAIDAAKSSIKIEALPMVVKPVISPRASSRP